ncbi:hypothetical protein BDL97_14G104100 [Sphagnum fallax]|nr:hypothetical protein BDL97_14G104100 [Sphagnum fallax]
MPGRVKQGRLPRAADDDDELVTVVPGIPTTRIADLPSSVQDPTFYDYEPYLKSSVVTLKAAGVLINTFYDPESRNIDVLQTTLYGGSDRNGQGHLLRILPVGPMLPPANFTPAASNLRSCNGGPAATTAQTTKLQDHPTTDLEPCLQWLWKQLPASADACLAPPS